MRALGTKQKWILWAMSRGSVLSADLVLHRFEIASEVHGIKPRRAHALVVRGLFERGLIMWDHEDEDRKYYALTELGKSASRDE